MPEQRKMKHTFSMDIAEICEALKILCSQKIFCNFYVFQLVEFQKHVFENLYSESFFKLANWVFFFCFP